MLGVPGDASERGPADATAMTVYTELGQNGHGSALEGQKKRSYRCVFSFTRVVRFRSILSGEVVVVGSC